MFPSWFLRACGIAGAFLFTGTAAAQDTNQFGCDRPIQLAFYEYGSLYHQGVGIDPDVVAELAKRTGCRFELSVMQRAQAWQKMQSNELDMISSGIATPERRDFAYFINYIAFKDLVVARSEIGLTVKSFEDITANDAWRVGVVSSYVYGPFYDNRLENIRDRSRISGYPDQAALYRALQDGAVDVILSPALNYEFYLPLTEMQQPFIIVDVSPAPPMPHGLVLRKNRFTPAMVNAWTRVLEQMRLDGTLERIYRQRLLPEVAAGLLKY